MICLFCNKRAVAVLVRDRQLIPFGFGLRMCTQHAINTLLGNQKIDLKFYARPSTSLSQPDLSISQSSGQVPDFEMQTRLGAP